MKYEIFEGKLCSTRRTRRAPQPRFFIHAENGVVVADFATRERAERQLKKLRDPFVPADEIPAKSETEKGGERLTFYELLETLR